MRPEEVRSPANRIQNLQIIHNDEDGGWSVAVMDWLHEHNNAWGRRIGIRWNGADNELGNPQSTGHATWFLLPENTIADVALAFAHAKAARVM